MDNHWMNQLTLWHEADEYQQIVDSIMEVPAQERDYAVIGHLARALNNLERYEEALEQLLAIAGQGANDPLWHFRAGYSYYYLKQYEEAARAFKKADELDPGDQDTLMLLNWSVRGAEKQKREQKRFAAAQMAKEQSGDSSFFEPADFSDFWENSDYALKEYVSEPPTEEMIASVEQELGYKLPASYIELMKLQNGGIPQNTCFPTGEATSWAEDHIAISSIMGIGREKSYSLCGDLGSRFMIEEWGYPDIGVVICDCPSAGHDVVMLDYRLCGREGEPAVIHVDQEGDYEITFLAGSFEAFIRGLVNDEEYDYDVSEDDGDEGLTQEAIEEGDQLKPFILVEQDNGGMSVILNAGSYKAELFQTREDEGFEGSGYDWASLASVFLEEKMPELADSIHFDPEADMFCAYSSNREAVQSFAAGFKAACEDDALIRDLFSRAELD
ncbi:glucan biosynthesis protein [Paenibacillus sp. FSL H7-0357]|uniref:Imm51 family immunity protein n=1 Tax=Paenibacillus sp. FSL H7-0357 TaxID=1536774 RepID=UPI0004F62114|nr:Imm51 family immunity protein [Paenibacillus sp. FSL H7-0357]AIQ21203.1 glucan biosynthesis protein [Paenibacillus sp. FSL H7-0357]